MSSVNLNRNIHASYFIVPESGHVQSSKRVGKSEQGIPGKSLLGKLLSLFDDSKNKKASAELRRNAYQQEYAAVYAGLHANVMRGRVSDPVVYTHKHDRVRSYKVPETGIKAYQVCLGRKTLEEMAKRLSEHTTHFGASVTTVPIKQDKGQKAMQFMTFGGTLQGPVSLKADRPASHVVMRGSERCV